MDKVYCGFVDYQYILSTDNYFLFKGREDVRREDQEDEKSKAVKKVKIFSCFSHNVLYALVFFSGPTKRQITCHHHFASFVKRIKKLGASANQVTYLMNKYGCHIV